MIIVNFKVVFGDNGANWVRDVVGFLDGKAAATFVVLAGIGLALMTNRAIENKDQVKLKNVRVRIVKRAVFLFLVGISYIAIWPADILHFYGIYMAITLLLLTRKERTILITATFLILAFPLLMIFWNYETGWNFATLDYDGFWTAKGFIRNLFYNGFHPVIPWTSFMLFGFWFGKQDLYDDRWVKKTFWLSAAVFVVIQLVSHLAIWFLSAGDEGIAKELTEVLGTNPMPPLPIYMFNGLAFAVLTISTCILVAKRFKNAMLVKALNKTGQLALTFYVAHVIIGMGIIELLHPVEMGKYPIEFSVSYALGFSMMCVVFAVIWSKYKKSGPLEWIMRKVTN